MIYASINNFIRYYINIKRNDTINVFFIYIIVDYLSYIAIKKNYFNKKVIFD